VNYLADVLHGFWLASGQPIPEFHAFLLPLALAVTLTVLALKKRRE
jgi:hypothetical protein